jgi:hypothetical protein
MIDTRWWPLELGRNDDIAPVCRSGRHDDSAPVCGSGRHDDSAPVCRSGRHDESLDFCVRNASEHHATFPCDVVCRM